MKYLFIYLTTFVIGGLGAYLTSEDTKPTQVNTVDCLQSQDSQLKQSGPQIELLTIPTNIGGKACDSNSTNKLLKSFKNYNKKVLAEVFEYAEIIKKEISKPLTENELKAEFNSKKEIQASIEVFNKRFPRFQLSSTLPDDYLYYGIHSGDYKDASSFLGERVCSNPYLRFADSTSAYLGLFFSINNGRDFGGIVRIINERIVTLIEGNLRFSKIDRYFDIKRIPTAFFRTWVHEDLEREYKGWVYQDQVINHTEESWRSQIFQGPWLYNSCNKSISTVSNNCSLDPSFDMEYKDFFYLTDFDLLLGNIYCKKSSENAWTRLATFEFIRI